MAGGGEADDQARAGAADATDAAGTDAQDTNRSGKRTDDETQFQERNRKEIIKKQGPRDQSAASELAI